MHGFPIKKTTTGREFNPADTLNQCASNPPSLGMSHRMFRETTKGTPGTVKKKLNTVKKKLNTELV
jgi:hypothetical protein